MSGLIQLTDFLKIRLAHELPGKQAHFKMLPLVRLPEFDPIPEKARKSSVLLLLFEDHNKICTILTQRHTYKGVHSDQISFPGGSYHTSDGSLEHTALRETEEEIGLQPDRVHIIGSLTDLYIPPSNFRVRPFIAYCTEMNELVPDKHEVKKIIPVEINEFAGNKNVRSKKIRIQNGSEFDTLYYDVKDLTIWGATAMILSEFAELLKDYERISK
ncbi:MAG TPA: CoA pyrophosphatase [Bacteroidales bacterium]|nr:CoA pyrophosphatase [Bacteroidales bacterium]